MMSLNVDCIFPMIQNMGLLRAIHHLVADNGTGLSVAKQEKAI
ncbi:hypothetical protein [Oceanisphaera psychrotolerans]|nr:hypothetical protein [Oceanisphaera psychrotolerans]